MSTKIWSTPNSQVFFLLPTMWTERVILAKHYISQNIWHSFVFAKHFKGQCYEIFCFYRHINDTGGKFDTRVNDTGIMETISGCLQLKVNLKEKFIYI
jgi:hypothetical protein